MLFYASQMFSRIPGPYSLDAVTSPHLKLCQSKITPPIENLDWETNTQAINKSNNVTIAANIYGALTMC